MADDNLMLTILKRLQDDMGDVKARLHGIEEQIASTRGDIAAARRDAAVDGQMRFNAYAQNG